MEGWKPQQTISTLFFAFSIESYSSPNATSPFTSERKVACSAEGTFLFPPLPTNQLSATVDFFE
jgi:hypothetical protein